MQSPLPISFSRFSRLLLLVTWLVGGTVCPAVFAQGSGKKPNATPRSTSKAAAPPATASTYAVPEVLATVDGVPIHKKEIQNAVEALLANQGRTLQSVSAEEQKQAYQTVLNSAIISHLLGAQATNESVPETTVETQYAALQSEYRSDSFEAELKKSGQTPVQLRETLGRQLAQQQWVEHQIADQIKITPEEVEKFYKEGPPERFALPETVRASHILVAVRKDAPPEDALDAENKIKGYAERIKKGESFSDVAKQSSDDPQAKTNGGDLGDVPRDRIMPEFADVAFGLKIGQVSDPVRTQMGYHLIKISDHQKAHTATLDEARPQITAYLSTAKRQAAVDVLLQRLRDNAKIEVFLP